MKKCLLLLCFYLLFNGFLPLYANEDVKARHIYLESCLLHGTKESIQEILHTIEISEDFCISLDELKAYVLTEEDVMVINRQIVEFFYVSLHNCKKNMNEACYFNTLSHVYNRRKLEIEHKMLPLEEKKSTSCLLSIAYLVSGCLLNSVLLEWKNEI